MTTQSRERPSVIALRRGITEIHREQLGKEAGMAMLGGNQHDTVSDHPSIKTEKLK